MQQAKGFTLIEVLIALTVFVIGVVLLFPIFSGGIKIINNNDNKLTVTQLAQNKMAEIKAAGFQSSPSDIPRTVFASPYDNYEYEINWTSLATDSISGNNVLYEVELIIYWHEGANERKEIFKTYLSKKTPA